MKAYLFHVERADRPVTDLHVLVCEGDVEARLRARSLLAGQAHRRSVEVWDEERQVGIIRLPDIEG